MALRYGPLTIDQTAFLKRYVAFQMMRTPAYIQDLEDALSVGFSSIYAMDENSKGVKDSRPPIAVTDAKIWAWTHLQAVDDTVLDLDVRYLVSKRNGFLTSDQPSQSITRNRSWNSTRYTDDEGDVSYLRTSPRGLAR